MSEISLESLETQVDIPDVVILQSKNDDEKPSLRLQPELSLRLNLLFALVAGVSQGNLYWCQFIQSRIADAFGVSKSRIGLIVSLSQAGHAVGLLLVMPLGDILPYRTLSLCLCSISTALMIALSFTPWLELFYVFSFVVGIASALSHLMIPLVAQLAPPERKGRAISIVWGGLMTGILYARLGAGIIETYAGWRTVYYQAAGITALMSMFVVAFFPHVPIRNHVSYGHLMSSMWVILKTEPLVQQTCAIGACQFIAYMLFWSDLSFLLTKPPYNYNSTIVGLLALIGITGILFAPFAGRIGDLHGSFKTGAMGIGTLILSASIMWPLGGTHLAGIIVGGILLDNGYMLIHVANQLRIFAVNPAARSRLNSVYMVSCFLGASIGTQSGAALMEMVGWKGAMMLSFGVSVLAFGIHCIRIPAAKSSSHSPKDHEIQRQDSSG